MRLFASLVGCLLIVGSAHAQPTLLVSNETGTSIATVNAATGAVGTFHTGLSNPDGLMVFPDGQLYATSFTGGTFNRITSANTFQTIASGMNGSAGFDRDAAGNVYVANFGAPSGGGTGVSRIAPDGSITVNFANGLSTPDDVIFDHTGTILYVSEWGGHRVRRIDPATGAVTPFVGPETGAGLDLPSAMARDSAGNLYVTNWGNATVSRVAPDGTVTNNFATNVPNSFGLLLDEEGGFFYATSYYGGTVSRFPLGGGSATVIAAGLDGPTFLAVQPVPEPTGVFLIGAGVVAVCGVARRVTSCRSSRGLPSGPSSR
jgi:sugar lactone lactonase YvrE